MRHVSPDIIRYSRESHLYFHDGRGSMAVMIIGSERIEVGDDISIEKAAINAGRHPDAFIFLVEGRPVPVTMMIKSDMEIETVRVASGG
jgi:sulfur carrier protein